MMSCPVINKSEAMSMICRKSPSSSSPILPRPTSGESAARGRVEVRGAVFLENNSGFLFHDYFDIPNEENLDSLPGVARRLVTFFVLPKKITKKSRPQSATSSRFPALLGWSGFLINSHDPLRVHVLKHIGYDITLRLVSTATSRFAPCCRQNSLTSLRYSVAEQGREKRKPYLVGWAHCPPTIKLPRGHGMPTLQHQREGA